MSCCAAFHGHITEIPNISVDNFTNTDAKAYFLSHTHSDHTQGLYDYRLVPHLEKNDAYIYMSEASAAIVNYEVKCRAKNKELYGIVERIKVLMLETESITLPEDPQQRLRTTVLLVTMVPAGHSFGSVMFLFRANSKTILYTGDFRMSCNDVSKYSQLHDKGSPIQIDCLYVDTTFIDAQYTNFPKRSASVESAIAEIEKWLKKDKNNRVAIKTSAKFGYEYVYNELDKKLGLKVFVEDVRWKELYCPWDIYYRIFQCGKCYKEDQIIRSSHLLHLVSGVTNNSSRVHLCWPKHLKDHTKCVPFEAVENLNFLHIHLSAQKWQNYEVDDEPIDKLSDSEIDVCFSTHCSRSELRYFVNYFSPKNIIGFPKSFVRSPVKKLHDNFCVSPKKSKLINGNKKMDRNLLKEMFDL